MAPQGGIRDKISPISTPFEKGEKFGNKIILDPPLEKSDFWRRFGSLAGRSKGPLVDRAD
jgi:hypothetical protein